MSDEPIVKPGTVFRLPIKVEGFIEFRFPKDVRVVIDPYDYEYSGWPRVSPYGDDADIVQIDDGPGHRRIEADIEVVEPIHVLVDRWIDENTPWLIERGHNESVTKETE